MWLPVFLGLGIGGYFSLPVEPEILTVAISLLVIVLGCLLVMRFTSWLAIPAILISVASGFALAKMRTELVRAPVIEKAKGFYAIEGRLERLTLLPGNEKQLHLVNLVISKIKPEKTPLRVRITSRIKDKALIVGSRIKLRAVLRPPPGPVRPGGFDFARQVWFARLGAVGFAVSKVEVIKAGPKIGLGAGSERIRQIVSDKIKGVITGHGGDIAVALIVGEKRSIDKQVLGDIRAAGLAHMLAISGMHMALVSGTMFWVLRALLAMSQTLALSFDVRKIAAVGAIMIAGSYFMLSGMGVSTLRAFIMITIMFVAVLLGRKALSLRNVSIAALIILVFRPESLLEVGFQMSFASVVALVSVYESGIFNRKAARSDFLAVRVTDKVVRGMFGIFATTLVAGGAVAPIAVYHFHHITTYSVVGNVLAMPVLSLVVMPSALAGLIAMPFDLHALPMSIMGQGNNLIVSIAKYVAGFEGARVNVGTIGLSSLLLIVVGGLWLCLWKSSYRYGGLVVVVAGLVLSLFRPTPFLLVERDARNIVLIDRNKTMWAMAPRVGRYSLDKWRSAYGATVSPQVKNKAGRLASGKEKVVSVPDNNKWRCDELGCTALYQSMIIAYSSHPGALGEDCARADILVATYPVPETLKSCRRGKSIIDIKSLRRNGSHAIYLDDGLLKIVNSREIRGKRPWTLHN